MISTASDPPRGQRVTALVLATLGFGLCFAAWVINSVLVIHLVSTHVFDWSDAQDGWLLALPFFTGAMTRVPLGLLTDRYGGRAMYIAVMLVAAAALVGLSMASGYGAYAVASLGVGVAGGSFSVGTGYVCAWFETKDQGTALGVFGTGTAGPAITLALAPGLLLALTSHGQKPEAWRDLPRIYAGALVLMALVFWVVGRRRVPAGGTSLTLRQRLAPLRDVVVWRFGLYYLLVFGGAVAMTQWIVPYGINVYGLSIAQAGLLASMVSAPSGLIKAAGGWLSDRFGAGPLMFAVFAVMFGVCLALGVPRMDVASPGEGVRARVSGVVERVAPGAVVVAGVRHPVVPPAQPVSARQAEGVLPRVVSWHVPSVTEGQRVVKKELLAAGVTHVLYPANLTLFSALLVILALASGVGMAGVLKFIPERFPNSVGAVGGLVGMLGALGVFVLPLGFSALLHATGLWTSCFWILALVALGCLVSLHVVRRRILREEAPDLVCLIERAAGMPMAGGAAGTGAVAGGTIEEALTRVPFLAALSREELAGLARIGARRDVPAGTRVFEQGDPGDALYVVISGRVDVVRRDSPGAGHRVATLGQGQYFGELALLDGGTRSATVMAPEPCTLFMIPRAEFLGVLARSPRLIAHLLVGLSRRLRHRDLSTLSAGDPP